MADPQINTTSEVTIVPVTVPEIPPEPPELARMQDRALATAMRYNPAIQEGRLRVEIAEINVRVAKNQQMPRVDLIGSIRSTGLAETSTEAQTQLNEGQYLSWGVGLSIEIPLGNRQQDAEVMRRHWEQRKAVSILHSAADQVAVQVKERARKVHTTLQQVHIQKQAAQAAQSQLKALEESEPIREKLTPEFMLVKLQAQETYAQTRRAEISALAEFNIAAADLARTTGTVLQLHRVQEALTTVTATAPPKKEEATAPPDKQETTPPPAEENKAPQPKRSPPASSWPTGFPYSLPEKLN
jgi:outer membrane protein TolC